MDKYRVALNPNGKSQEAVLLEKVLADFDKGVSIAEMMKKYHMLKLSQIQACQKISSCESSREDIELVGGLEAVVKRMIEIAEFRAVTTGYSLEQIGAVMPHSEDILMVMMNEKMQEEYRQRFTIEHPMRMKALRILYNSAVDLVHAEYPDIEEMLVDYARRMGDIPITVGGENPMIEAVDVKAAIALAQDVKNKKITGAELKEVGGADKVIDEMSIQAKMDAFEERKPMSQAKDLLATPKDIISNMSKETDRGIEY